MDGLEIASKLWLLISGFVVAVIGVVAFILKIKSDSREEHLALKGRLDLMQQEIISNKTQNDKEHEQFAFVIEHLTKAGENIKDQMAGFIDIIGSIKTDVALTKQSVEGLTEMVRKLLKIN
jgi:hypothetical protein